MKIVNETGQELYYNIGYPGAGDCGTIAVDGFVDLPTYDNQPVVDLTFAPTTGSKLFAINLPTTKTDEQVEMAIIFE